MGPQQTDNINHLGRRMAMTVGRRREAKRHIDGTGPSGSSLLGGFVNPESSPSPDNFQQMGCVAVRIVAKIEAWHRLTRAHAKVVVELVGLGGAT